MATTKSPQTRDHLDTADLGTLSVPEFVEIQADTVRRRLAGEHGDRLLVVRHPPTVSYSGQETPYLTLDDAALESAAIAVHRVARGGGPLFVGPGQLNLCPVVDIGSRPEPWEFPRLLETVLIDALGLLGLPAHRRDDAFGVWVNDRKVATVGIGVRRGISSFGLTVNIAPRFDLLGVVPPCGASCATTSSLTREFGERAPGEAELVHRFGEAWTARAVARG